MKVLIIEDNRVLGKSLKRVVEEAGCIVDLAKDGEEGLYFTEVGIYDVIVLDWMLPKISGIELLRALRERSNNVPTIMVTARSDVADRVEGLECGADDYIVKPFAMVELVARIKALYRRSLGAVSSLIVVGAISLDISRHQAMIGAVAVDFTGKVFDLLAALAARCGQLVSRATLNGVIYEMNEEPESNSLDVLLVRLRKKINGSGTEIITFRGKGFMLRVA